MAILYRCVAVCPHRPPSMVCHRIGSAAIDSASMVGICIAFPYFGLAVPTGKFHKIEQPYSTPGSIVILAPFGSLSGGANPEIVPSDAYEGSDTALGNMARPRIITAQIVPGTRVLLKPRRSAVCDIIINPAIGRVVNDFEEKFRDIHHCVMCSTGKSRLPTLGAYFIPNDVVFFHSCPGIERIERRAACPGSNRRGGCSGDGHICKTIGVVAGIKTGEFGRGAGVIPHNTEHLGVEKFHPVLFDLLDRHNFGGSSFSVKGGLECPISIIADCERSLAAFRGSGH